MQFLVKYLNESVILLIKWINRAVDASVAVLDVEVDGKCHRTDCVLQVRLRDSRVIYEDCGTRTKLSRHTAVRTLLRTQPFNRTYYSILFQPTKYV